MDERKIINIANIYTRGGKSWGKYICREKVEEKLMGTFVAKGWIPLKNNRDKLIRNKMWEDKIYDKIMKEQFGERRKEYIYEALNIVSYTRGAVLFGLPHQLREHSDFLHVSQNVHSEMKSILFYMLHDDYYTESVIQEIELDGKKEKLHINIQSGNANTISMVVLAGGSLLIGITRCGWQPFISFMIPNYRAKDFFALAKEIDKIDWEISKMEDCALLSEEFCIDEQIKYKGIKDVHFDEIGREWKGSYCYELCKPLNGVVLKDSEISRNVARIKKKYNAKSAAFLPDRELLCCIDGQMEDICSIDEKGKCSVKESYTEWHQKNNYLDYLFNVAASSDSYASKKDRKAPLIGALKRNGKIMSNAMNNMDYVYVSELCGEDPEWCWGFSWETPVGRCSGARHCVAGKPPVGKQYFSVTLTDGTEYIPDVNFNLEFLGVSAAEAKRLYTKYAKIYHPDQKTGSEEKFLELKQVYEQAIGLKSRK